MATDDSDLAGSIDRRTILRNAGALGAISVLGAQSVSGRPQDSGPQEECPCLEDADAWGKYEFEEGEEFDGEGDCGFEFDEGSDLVEITSWENKENEDCEPIEVDYEAAEGYAVTYICAFGGTDNDDDDDPDGETYVSDLETPSGERAAISNILLCLEEVELSCPEGLELKYDLEDEEWDPEETHGIEFVAGDETGATFYAPFPVDVYVFGGNYQEQQHRAVSGEFDVRTVDRGDHPGGDADIGHVWFVCPGADEPSVGSDGGGNGGERGGGPP